MLLSGVSLIRVYGVNTEVLGTVGVAQPCISPLYTELLYTGKSLLSICSSCCWLWCSLIPFQAMVVWWLVFVAQCDLVLALVLVSVLVCCALWLNVNPVIAL